MEESTGIKGLWGKLKSALSCEERTSHEDHVPRNRMKQLETRCSGLTGVSLSDEQLIDSIASQKTTVNDAALHWSTNPDKGIRQEIRRVHQLGGVAKGFEIDPLANLD